MSTKNAEKDGALNTASRLQKAKNRSTLHLRASYDLKPRNLKSAKIVFFVVNQLSDGRRRGYDVFPVKTAAFETSIRQVCEERKDEWS